MSDKFTQSVRGTLGPWSTVQNSALEVSTVGALSLSLSEVSWSELSLAIGHVIVSANLTGVSSVSQSLQTGDVSYTGTLFIRVHTSQTGSLLSISQLCKDVAKDV